MIFFYLNKYCQGNIGERSFNIKFSCEIPRFWKMGGIDGIIIERIIMNEKD